MKFELDYVKILKDLGEKLKAKRYKEATDALNKIVERDGKIPLEERPKKVFQEIKNLQEIKIQIRSWVDPIINKWEFKKLKTFKKEM